MDDFMISVKMAGGKYVATPTNKTAYESSEAKKEPNIWYYETSKSSDEFAKARVFKQYESLQTAEQAILAVDPGSSRVYKPPTPPTTTADF